MNHILLISTNARVTETVEAMLKVAGFTVWAAKDGADGLVKWRRKHPDLVIADIIMPGMRGVETILRLRELDPEQPILALPGPYDWESTFGKSLSWIELVSPLEANEVLPKPFEGDRLLRAVRKCLSPAHRRSMPEARHVTSIAA